MMSNLAAVLNRIDRDLPDSLERLKAFLRFPSISTDAAHDGACRDTAEWVKAHLQDMGFSAALHNTTGHPVVLAELVEPGLAASAPHVLFYGHYDVQPVDPVELWTHPPFEPTVVKGGDGRERLYARGAADDKGQLMTFLTAVKAWREEGGRLPFRLTVLIEGDEEGNSQHLEGFVAARAGSLKPDICFVCDTGLWDDDTPQITTSLRGCIADEVIVTGPRIDLHSGYYGGPPPHPPPAPSRGPAAPPAREGPAPPPPLPDGGPKLTPRRRKELQALRFNTRKFLGDVGLKQPAGEKNFTALEQIWLRPTAEVNGIIGGYTGEGSKTVLPSKASAKLTFRLVAGQNPTKIRKAFRAFIRRHLPKDCTAEFHNQTADNHGVSVSADSIWVAAARKALKDEWGRKPVIGGEGGSIPVVGAFARYLGADSLLVGFSRANDAVHSPNEKYDLDCFQRGARSWARLIAGLAEGAK